VWPREKHGDIITKIRECFLLQTVDETSMILAVGEKRRGHVRLVVIWNEAKVK
jgi:hypothetical protein